MGLNSGSGSQFNVFGSITLKKKLPKTLRSSEEFRVRLEKTLYFDQSPKYTQRRRITNCLVARRGEVKKYKLSPSRGQPMNDQNIIRYTNFALEHAGAWLRI